MNPATAGDPARSRYHHGSLRAALVQAGLDLARDHGLGAIVLREVTRRAGVSPRAAYRHFADREALVEAVSLVTLASLAEVVEARQRQLLADERASRGRELLRGVGEGYIAFALDEPGWFEVSFFAVRSLTRAHAAEAAGSTGRTAYELLHDAVAQLVADRELPAARAEEAARFCWSTVHGFATLAAFGPFAEQDRAALAVQGEQVVDAAIAAMCGGAAQAR